MTRDCYEFIIIDQVPGRTFNILDVVADALCKLKGDLPHDASGLCRRPRRRGG